MTFPGLYVVEHFGRRRALICGGLWDFMCFLVFSSIGHFKQNQNDPQSTPGAGTVMIVFACLFIAGYAMTWYDFSASIDLLLGIDCRLT